MDVWALWFSLVLISQGVLLFMCFAAELSPSHCTLTFILTFSVPLVFQAQDFYVEMKWEFTSWGRCRIYTYDGIKFSCCDNCWSFYCGIRQGSKRNDDSVSVEELDWSAENQVLIPAEHLWCDFECRPWATNSPPNNIDLYIHYMDKSTGTPPSVEEKKALPNCGNKEIHVLKNCISPSVATVLKWLYPYIQVISVW